MSDEISFDGVKYISANNAGSLGNFTRDYVARLCRDGRVRGRQIGKHWYVDQTSFQTFLLHQQFVKSTRKEALAKERVQEYHGSIPAGPRPAAGIWNGAKVAHSTSLASVPISKTRRALQKNADDVRRRLSDGFAKTTESTLSGASRLASAPAGFTHAALTSTHVPVYALSPLAEFLHKLVALTLALMLTFGTYALVDPQYARFAAESVSDQTASALAAYRSYTGGGVGEMANRAEVQLAAAAEDPGGAFASAQNIFSGGFSALARAVNKNVNTLVYGIAFPRSLVESLGIVSSRASVAISVSPRSPAVVSNESVTSTARAIAGGSKFVGSQTVVSNPIVERIVETQRILSAGGLTEEILNQKLQELDNKLTARIYSTPAPAIVFSGSSYSTPATTQTVALSNKIDHLKSTAIESPTITGGTISGTDITANTLTASGAAAFNDNANVSGQLAVTMQAGQTSNPFQISNNAGATLFSVGPDGTLTTLVSTSTSIYSSILITGNATATTLYLTNLIVADTASTTNLKVINSTTTNATSTNLFVTNASTTNATSTNFFAVSASTTNATSTSLYAALGHFVTGIIDTLTATVATITNLTATNLTATNATSTNATSTNFSVQNISATGSSTLQNFTFVNATGSSATTTNFFATTASSTNLHSQTASLGALSAGTLALTTALPATSGGTGQATVVTGDLLYGSAANAWSRLGIGTGGFVLGVSGGLPAWVATTTFASPFLYSAGNVSFDFSTANTWTGLNQFQSGASTTKFSAYNNAYFGASATSSFNSAGALTLITPLLQGSGGTGFSSYTAGDVLYADNVGNLTRLGVGSSGQVLKVQAGLPAWGIDNTGSGGGSGFNMWATTTLNLIYPVDTSYPVSIGSNSTSSLNSIFEVHGIQYISSKLGIATTSPVSALSVGGDAYITGGLGVGLVNTVAGTLQTNGNATIGGTLTVGALSGAVSASAGVLSAGTLSIANGGTNSAGYSTNALLYYNGTSIAATSTQPLYVGQVNATTTNATSTFAGGFNVASGGLLYDLSTLRVGVGTTSPWALLSINPSGISGPEFAVGSSTQTDFVITNGGRVGVGTSTPGTLFSVAGAANFVNAGTSTILTGLQTPYLALTGTVSTSTAGNGWNIAAGCFSISNTCLSLTNISGTLAANQGGTGFSSYTPGDILYAQTASSLARVASSSNGFVLTLANGIPSWVATTTLSTISGTLGISSGGTNQTAYSANALLFYDSPNGKIAATSSNPLYVSALNATSSTQFSGFATSTPWALLSINPSGISGPEFAVGSSTQTDFVITNGGRVGVGTSTPGTLFSVAGAANFVNAGTSTILTGLQTPYLALTGTVSTSTAGNGWNIAAGCFSISNICLSLTNISGTLAANQGGTGTTTWQTGSIPFYNGTNFTENNNRFYWDNSTNRLGIGTTTPPTPLAVSMSTVSTQDHVLTLEQTGISGNNAGPFIDFKTGGGITRASIGGEFSGTRAGDMVFYTHNNSSADVWGTNILERVRINNAGNVGIGTTSPWGLLSINPSGISGPEFAVGSSTQTDFVITNGGRVGVGTSTPGTLFSVAGAANFVNAGTSTILTGLQTPYLALTGTVSTSTAANGFNLSAGCFAVNNTCVGGGGSAAVGGTGAVQFANGTALNGTTNFFWDNTLTGLGLGTSTPRYRLTVSSSTAPQLALTDASLTSNQWTFRSTGSFLYIATSSPSTFATSTTPALTIDNNGNVGVGTSTPGSMLSIGANAGVNFTSATTTFATTGGINLGSGCFSVSGTCLSTIASNSGVILSAIRVYTTTTNWSKPSGLSYVIVETWGGGGGGGGGGFASGNTGGTGGTSNFGGMASSTGGIGGGGGQGINTGPYTGGAGGTGQGGDVNLIGQDGGHSLVGVDTGLTVTIGLIGGNGGSAPRGGGGVGAGTAGYAFGGGGGGGTGQSSVYGGGGGGGGYTQNLWTASSVFLSGTTSVQAKVGGGGTASSHGGAVGGAGGVVIYEYTTTGLTVGSNNSGTQGQVAYYDSTGQTLSGTSTLTITQSQLVGVGTTSPWGLLSINPNGISGPEFAVGSSTQTDFVITNGGRVGVGTSTPGTLFSVAGAANFVNAGTSTILTGLQTPYLALTGTVSTSTAANGFNLSAGCFAVNNTCVGGSSFTNTLASGGTATTTFYNGGVVFSDGNKLTQAAAASSFYWDNTNSSLGLGTSTPWAQLSVNPSGISGPEFAIGSSTATHLVLTNGGLFGLGTTSPFRRLSVTDTTANSQVALAYDATRYAEIRVDSTGGLNIEPSGNNAYFNNDNLWVCTGGSISVNGCPSGTPSGQGNIIVENKVGIGTTTPNWALQVAGTRPFLAISDASAGANLEHWTLSSQGGWFYIATSSDALATSTVAAVTINKNGSVGIGTTSPSTQLSISNLLFVGANNVTTLGQATSTFYGDIKIAGKLDVSTIDPVYTIDGTKYATYGASTVGVREETLETVQLNEKNTDGRYEYVIPFSTLQKGSDLWLFYQITDFGKDWSNLVVSLTPSFDGNAFYKKDVSGNRLIVYADQPGEVSMRLSAYRYDFTKWGNLRPDQNDATYKGFDILSKPSIPQAPAAF